MRMSTIIIMYVSHFTIVLLYSRDQSEFPKSSKTIYW